MTGDLETKIRHAPRGPGVYLMKDGTGAILYVCLLYTSDAADE